MPPSSPAPAAATTAAEAPDPLLVPPEVMTTNAVNRNLSDLHMPTWLALLAINITGRTLVFHPLQLAISRKRVTRAEQPPTAGALMKAAYRGGKQGFPAGKGGGGVCEAYDFGRGGIRGCYRGVGAALLSNVVGEISYLFTLEKVKERLGKGSAVRARPSPSAAGVDVGSEDGAASEGQRRDAQGSGAVEPPLPIPAHALPDKGDDGEDRCRPSPPAVPVESGDFAANSASAAVGGMAGDLVALALVTPTVVVCNRQMTAGYGMAAGNAYRSVAGTFREVWSAYQDPKTAAARAKAVLVSRAKLLSPQWWHNGLRGVYQGTSAGLLRIPSSGCWWALYTKSKEAVYRVAAPTLARMEERRLRELAGAPDGAAPPFWKRNWFLSPTDNPLLNATAGIFASVSTTVLFNPMAVIQTRQQSLSPEFWVAQRRQVMAHRNAAESAAHAASLSYKVKRLLPFQKVYAVAADLVRTEGPKAFFKGASANVGVAVVDGVIFSLLFELSKLGSDTQFLGYASVEVEKRE